MEEFVLTFMRELNYFYGILMKLSRFKQVKQKKCLIAKTCDNLNIESGLARREAAAQPIHLQEVFY